MGWLTESTLSQIPSNSIDKVSWLPVSASELSKTNDMSKDNETIETKSHAPLSDVRNRFSIHEENAIWGVIRELSKRQYKNPFEVIHRDKVFQMIYEELEWDSE